MVKIKSQAEIAARYKDGIGRAGPAYKRGVEVTTDWQEKAVAAQPLYEEKMSNPDVLARRGKALAQVSNEEWRSKAVKLGSARIGPGMTENQEKRTRNYEPIRTAIEGATLPDRTADAMANIDNRVKGIVKIEQDAKKARLG